MTPERGNILIVDDTLESLQVLANTLSEQGYKVRGAAKGKMALRTARSSPPDLILLDIKMPEMSGYEVCEQLKADEQTREIPVIFISALDEAIDKVKAFNLGGVDYITKPFQVEEVLARIEHQLTIQRLSKQLRQQNQQLQEEIVERKKAEEDAAAANRAKSEFLANMSHELRTPLNAILGFTQVMNRTPQLEPEQREYLDIINRSGEHLLELINDILDLSKIEAGALYLHEKNFDLYRLLDNLEELFQIQAEQKNLDLIFTIAPDVPQYIKTDEQKLRSCLLNLISNGIKFTTYGSVTLVVERCETLDSYLQFSVSDTGLGMKPEEMDALFDAFVQTSAGLASAEGTGLGLAITKKFVQLMGGEITVNSVFGEGTTFQFTIAPAEVGVAGAIAPPRQRVIGIESPQDTYRILVVDDTKTNRLLLVKLLEPIGFAVREAANGLEGIALWESWHPHLILIDTRMPAVGGLEATREIRTREREMSVAEPTIIIALTASVFEERRGEILAAGSDDYLRKPFSEEIIFAKIAQYLGVSYRYEALPQTPLSSRQFSFVSKPDAFFLEEFATIPAAWVAELHEAANKLREESVWRLIEQIGEISPPLATALKELADDFRLDEIVRLTEASLT
jgi:signal transduction histidine kinase